MKKIISFASMAMAVATIAPAAAEQPAETTMNVHIAGIRGGEGTIFAVIMAPSDAATGQVPDFRSGVKSPGSMIPAMIPAREGSVDWSVPVAKVDAGARLYVFHDTNGNFRLDLGDDGTPLEGCAHSTLETVEPNGTATVELKYFN